MMKKVTLLALLVVCTFAVVWASPDAQKNAAGHAKMEAMKAEMMKCAVCKNVAMRMDEIGPMGMEPTKLNDGFAVRHWVISNDPAKVAAFHAACDACSKAGQASMTMTDEQAKTELCGFCQGIRTAMKSGAHMSQGSTKKGDVMIVTSSDPAVQSNLATLAQQCELMAASMEAPSPKASAEKP